MPDLLTKVLPAPGLPRTLCAQAALYAIGNGVYNTGNVVFFTLYSGLSPVRIGIGFSFARFIGLVGALPFGHLADRIGGQRAWVIGATLGSLAFLFYPFVHGFWAFLPVLALETIAEVLARAGRVVYQGAALPQEVRVRALAFIRAYQNIGFTLGAGMAGLALALDSRAGLLALVLVNAVGMAVNAFFVSRMPKATVAAAAGEKRPSPWGVLRDHPYTVLAAVFAVLWLHAQLWGDIMPLWAITDTDAPKPALGALVALNTILAVALQVPATRGAGTMRGSVRLLRWGGLTSALACPVLLLTGSTRGWLTVALLGLAVVLTTATELWASAAQWFMQTELPPAGQRGAYLGASRSIEGLGRMVGPASLTFLAMKTGGWGWWAIAALFAACAAVIGPAAGWVERTPRPAVAA